MGLGLGTEVAGVLYGPGVPLPAMGQMHTQVTAEQPRLPSDSAVRPADCRLGDVATRTGSGLVMGPNRTHSFGLDCAAFLWLHALHEALTAETRGAGLPPKPAGTGDVCVLPAMCA